MDPEDLLELMAEAEDAYVLSAETTRKEGKLHETEEKEPQRPCGAYPSPHCAGGVYGDRTGGDGPGAGAEPGVQRPVPHRPEPAGNGPY